MNRITPLPSGRIQQGGEDEPKLLIRSKPLLLCLMAGCYVLLIYRFGLLNATIAVPIIGIAIGRRLANVRGGHQG